ncbi:hypothetical protein NM688_g7253 [Phlebia brevispora]|uniref:Uncharacterized protein n=1 Tax=Phlebia brevispora TaxID=194682 RepID=A0ACC1S7G9_9APHY|nr:hypothetical protein NM688_g7253 [Phlebia brevispora]
MLSSAAAARQMRLRVKAISDRSGHQSPKKSGRKCYQISRWSTTQESASAWTFILVCAVAPLVSTLVLTVLRDSEEASSPCHAIDDHSESSSALSLTYLALLFVPSVTTALTATSFLSTSFIAGSTILIR